MIHHLHTPPAHTTCTHKFVHKLYIMSLWASALYLFYGPSCVVVCVCGVCAYVCEHVCVHVCGHVCVCVMMWGVLLSVAEAGWGVCGSVRLVWVDCEFSRKFNCHPNRQIYQQSALRKMNARSLAPVFVYTKGLIVCLHQTAQPLHAPFLKHHTTLQSCKDRGARKHKHRQTGT